jgi:hypothetical protein
VIPEVPMKRWFCLASAATLFLCIAAPLQAQPSDNVARRSASRDTRFESLRPDSGFPDWRRLSLEGGARPFDTGAAYVQTLPGDPLGMNAPETTTGYWRPLSQRLSSLVETSLVPGSLGVSERSVMGQLGTQLGNGWGMQAGIRHSDLGVAAPEANKPGLGLGLTSLPAPATAGLGADLGMLTFERFWDRYRGAYTVSSGRAEHGAIATSHRVQLNYFYAARSSVGLSYTLGRSFETSLPLNSMTPVETANVGVVGEHWFTPSWAINYNALIEDRGSEGLKPEIRLGLRLRF